MVDIKSSIPVFVLVCHHGSLAIARSLGRLGIDVYGFDRDVDRAEFLSRYFTGVFAWDLNGRPAPETVDYLCERARETGQRPLLIPTSDEMALMVAQNADALSECFEFARQDAALIEKLVSKQDNCELARAAGIPVPDTAFPQSVDDVQAFAENTVYPVMVKGISGAKLLARTGRKMEFANSRQELLSLYEQMEDPDDPNIMLQEYIPGGDDTIWMFDGYFDQSGKCRFGITGRKIRQTPPHMGSTSLGVCEHSDIVFELTTDLMSAIGYTGILDIGFRYDARDGQYKLLDPNPRIGSTFRLFVGTNGMDTARYLYMDVTGQTLPESTAKEGRKWVVEWSDLHAFAIYRREGTLTLWQWLRSFQGVEEAGWFARDDLKPFWRMFRRFMAGVVRFPGRSAARSLGFSPKSENG